LITPFKPPTNVTERNFNLRHAKERVIIERRFRQLKKRIPKLGNCVRITLEKVPKVIVCCAVLHNISKFLDDDDLLGEQYEIAETSEDDI
jgi:hypothetical protein